MIRRTSRLCNPQNTHAPLRRDRGDQNTCIYIPLAYVCRSVLSCEHRRMALSELGKLMLERTRRIEQAWAVLSYHTDQLMTPCSTYFLGGSTLNGTPGGDRWARVLGGQVDWLSDPLHRFEAYCSGSRNLTIQTHRKHEKIPPYGKHTTKPTSAQRPRPPRDRPRRNVPQALAHARLLP